ncbi:MAG TPA: hypothetical protein VFN23_20150, partial [Ktedonobacteraceae bacterium]|nr:hypothetical protein [Ktedonobacteraceae bacterium]
MSYPDDNLSSSVPSFSANSSDHSGEGNNARAMSMAQGSNAIQENVTKKKVGFSPLVVMNSQSQHDIEHYAESIVLVYVVAFVLVLLVMHIAGQVPGQSLALKVASNLMQLIGEVIALVFCLRPALRFRREYIYLRRLVTQNDLSRNAEMLAVRRLYLAWCLLAIGMALCISGGVIWTSYDIRMPSSQVPFPGLFDIGFVSCYPFFLLSTLLLNQDRRTGSERTRL